MNMKPSKILFLLLVLFLGLTACAEEPLVIELEEASQDSHASTQTSALITPEFRLIGLDEMPRELLLQQLSLAVSEIRLEPLRSHGGIAYSTSQPFELVFDLSTGEDSITFDAVELPETGRFLVSIRLEPPRHIDLESQMEGSLGMRGMIRTDLVDNLDDEDEKSDGEEHDGSPLPLPFDKIDEGDDDSWTPFTFTSERAVFYTFSDVEFDVGEQVLTFEFELGDWAKSAVNPLAEAIEENPDQEVVDISHEFDTPEAGGPEALLDTGSVSIEK